MSKRKRRLSERARSVMRMAKMEADGMRKDNDFESASARMLLVGLSIYALIIVVLMLIAVLPKI